MSRHRQPWEDDAIRDLFMRGRTVSDIARRTDRSLPFVRESLVRMGVQPPRRKGSAVSDSTRSEILALAASGYSQREISERVSRGSTVVNRITRGADGPGFRDARPEDSEEVTDRQVSIAKIVRPLMKTLGDLLIDELDQNFDPKGKTE